MFWHSNNEKSEPRKNMLLIIPSVRNKFLFLKIIHFVNKNCLCFLRNQNLLVKFEVQSHWKYWARFEKQQSTFCRRIWQGKCGGRVCCWSWPWLLTRARPRVLGRTHTSRLLTWVCPTLRGNCANTFLPGKEGGLRSSLYLKIVLLPHFPHPALPAFLTAQCISAATPGEPGVPDWPPAGVGVLGEDHQEAGVCGPLPCLGLAGGDGEDQQGREEDPGGGEGEGQEECSYFQDCQCRALSELQVTPDKLITWH